ncbi:hypothetical protein LBMAG47_01140 [Planctomycetia bacterium]|nr:hypothetical protein LBMAG47_01140 [Planctomycetia bacterium]
MTHPSAPVGWSLAGTVASTAASAPAATLDLATPAAGLEPAGLGRGIRLLGVDLRGPCGPLERWIRGADLIAVYEPDDPRRLRATALWRPWLAPTGVAAWELLLSAQTALVSSDSALAVVSEAVATEAAWGESTPAGWRWTRAEPGQPRPARATSVLVRAGHGADARPSLLVAVHPDDVRHIDIDRAGDLLRVRCWLFSTAIEKGQLFRSRVLAAVGPARDDEAWAGGLGSAFAAAPPPLTT